MNNQWKQAALDAIEQKQARWIEVADAIWEYAELSLQEYRSAALYEAVLAEEGFTVTHGIAGIETAFSGSFGSGRPFIGILAEYDALSGLSQQGGCTTPQAVIQGGNGHGCGHHMLGAGALAAAVGIKTYLEQSGRSGTVILFGTPGEEGGAAKAFMAKENLWRDLDAALAWHPSDINEVATGSCNSSIQVLYRFHGVAAHAAGDPEDGRSALDAVELMNIGVQYLREHTKPDARIHYAMVDGGGLSPNVVQANASVLYMVRSELCGDAVALTKRVDRIAEGAAKMTDTTVERVFIDGSSNTVPNHTIEALAYKNFTELGVPQYTEEEWQFAKALRETYPVRERLPSIAATYEEAAKETVRAQSENGTRALNDFLAPLYAGRAFEPGSTDVGDVSWQTPTIQIHVTTFPSGAPGHSWQNVSCGQTSIGYKGLVHAGKVLCATAIDLWEQPSVLAAAQAEFQKATASGYVCPIPPEETAKIVEL